MICTKMRKVTKDINGDGILDQFGIYNYDWLDAAYKWSVLFDENSMKIDLYQHNVVEAVKYLKSLYALNQGAGHSKDFDSGNVVFMPLSLRITAPIKLIRTGLKIPELQWDCITFPAGKTR